MNNKLNFDNKPLTPKPVKRQELFESSASLYKASEKTIRKIVVIGNASVGKTSIVSRFVNNTMPSSKKATIGALEKHFTYYL